MQTEHHRELEEPTHHHRRHGDGKINWSAVGVVLAFLVNVCTLVWIASARNSDILVLQAGLGEVKTAVQTLSNQAGNNSVRLGVLESKVDDLRDNQRNHP